MSTPEYKCFNCEAEYIVVTEQESELQDEPIFCPFCGEESDVETIDELDFDDDEQ